VILKETESVLPWKGDGGKRKEKSCFFGKKEENEVSLEVLVSNQCHGEM
jgi:hypothetical protein